LGLRREPAGQRQLLEAITGRQGRYRFVEVSPGGAWLQVMLGGTHPMGPVTEPFEVKPGDELHFDLVLRAGQ